jgi:outer membrane lipoprotein-sorting protein
MKKLIAVTAVVAGLAFSGVALASTCPLLIKQGKEAAAKMKADDPKVKDANAKLAEAQKLHDAGKHADSVKTANEALALLGVKPADKK